MSITADHMRYYRDGTPFYPCILNPGEAPHLAADAAMVELSCGKEAELRWDEALARAEAYMASGKSILWVLDFGIQLPIDQTTFLSHTVAIDCFVEKVWQRFSVQTFGVCVYRGEPPRDVEACDAFSEVLHRLVSFLPETVVVLCCFDLSLCINAAEQTVLVSQLRQEHIHLALRGARAPLSTLIWEESGRLVSVNEPEPQLAVCIPEKISDLTPLEAILNELKGTPFRVIAESRLTEEWDGINTLVVLAKAMSPLGNRKLKGFEAAGGVVRES